MSTKNPTPSNFPSVQPADDIISPPCELMVEFKGCFLFALIVATDPSTNVANVIGIDVFAPTSGHIYSGGFQGIWNNPYAPEPPAPDYKLLMLEPQRYCLELERNGSPLTGQTIPLEELRASLGSKNLWPDQARPLGLGWDFAVSLPVPDNVLHWTTTCMDVTGCFGGRNATFPYMGMKQKFKYKDISKFNLRGSPFPLGDVQPTPTDGKLTFIIDGETHCFPSLQHQRQAVNAIAQVMGLDLYLVQPITSNGGVHIGDSDDSNPILDSIGGGCMGGGIFQQFP